jgi:hypothetical protein
MADPRALADYSGLSLIDDESYRLGINRLQPSPSFSHFFLLKNGDRETR